MYCDFKGMKSEDFCILSRDGVKEKDGMCVYTHLCSQRAQPVVLPRLLGMNGCGIAGIQAPFVTYHIKSNHL